MTSGPVPTPALAEGRPRVSFVCAWYNRPDTLEETLTSMLGQDLDGFEIVLIDDGSPDPRVREILEGYADPRLTVLRHDNRGFVRTIRRAIEMSRAPLFAVQGAGDVSYPERLRVQEAFMTARPEMAAVTCSYAIRVVGGHSDEAPTIRRAKRDVYGPEHFAEGNPVVHGGVMVRRAAYDRVGGYRTFFRFSQDRDLWLRLVERDPIGGVPEVLYERRVFLKDGIAGSFVKSVEQIAYARLADASATARAAGRPDPLAGDAALPLSAAPRDGATMRRVLFQVRRLSRERRIGLSELARVRELFGWRIWLRAAAACVANGGFTRREARHGQGSAASD